MARRVRLAYLTQDEVRRLLAAASRSPRDRVTYDDGARWVWCPICEVQVRTSIVPHLKRRHSDVWARFVRQFGQLRRNGQSYKQIMRRFHTVFSWVVIARALAEAGEDLPPPKPLPLWQLFKRSLEESIPKFVETRGASPGISLMPPPFSLWLAAPHVVLAMLDSL